MEQCHLVPIHLIWKGRDKEDKVQKEEKKRRQLQEQRKVLDFGLHIHKSNLNKTQVGTRRNTAEREHFVLFVLLTLKNCGRHFPYREGMGNKPVVFYKRSKVRSEKRFLFLLGSVWWEDGARLRTGAWRQLVMEHVMSEPRRMHFTRFFFFSLLLCTQRWSVRMCVCSESLREREKK